MIWTAVRASSSWNSSKNSLNSLNRSCDPCDPSLVCLDDISPAQIYHADLTSVVFFLSFVAIYSLNVTYISSFYFFQILPAYSFHSFFSCVLLSLYSTFYLSPLFVFPCISSTFSFYLSCLSFTFLLCLLSFSSSSNFLCLPSNFPFCFYLFLCLLLSFFAFFYFHSLPVFYSIPLTPYSLFLLLYICVCFLLLLLLLLLSFLSSCSFFLFFWPIF